MKNIKKDTKVQKVNVLNLISAKIQSFKENLAERKRKKDENYSESVIPKFEIEKKIVVDILPGGLVKAAFYIFLLLVGILFLYDIRGTLLILFVAFLLAAAMDPLVDWMQKKNIPRSVSVLLIYIIFAAVAGILLTNLVSLIASQIVGIAKSVGGFVTSVTDQNADKIPFASQLRPYLDQIYQIVNLQAAATQIQNALQIVSTQLLSLSTGLFNVIIVLILTFFMTVEEKPIESFFQSLFPSKYAQYISTRLEAVKEHIGQWLRGQLFISIIAAVVSYVGLAIMNVDYALTLSVIAGICMVIPVMGRVFAWILTFPIVFNQSPILCLYMSIFYLIVQQFENNIIVPYIMNKAVGLNSIIIIFAMMIGGQYLGILGFVLAIPVATTVAIFFHDYTSRVK